MIETLISTWKNEIKDEYLAGNIVWESQLQALIFYFLKYSLSDEIYEIWSEPVLYDLFESSGKIKPDIIVSNKKTQRVELILELKVKSYQSIDGTCINDIKKMLQFKHVTCTCKQMPCVKKNHYIILGQKPTLKKWKSQIAEFKKNYNLLEKNLKANGPIKFRRITHETQFAFAGISLDKISNATLHQIESLKTKSKIYKLLMLQGFFKSDNSVVFDTL